MRRDPLPLPASPSRSRSGGGAGGLTWRRVVHIDATQGFARAER
jgi:hypothetical protein